MKTIPVNFFKEDMRFRLLQQEELKKWVHETVSREKHSLLEVNFIFCSDDYLKKMNKEYLNHSAYTDIITFDYSEEKKKISGDIFISVDRVKVNAKKFNTTFPDELHRVMIHGVLHLLGYNDKSKTDSALMKVMEDKYLLKRKFSKDS